MRRVLFLAGSFACTAVVVAACSGGDMASVPDDVHTVIGPDGTAINEPTVPDLGKECALPTECISQVCAAGRCAQPTPTDGARNNDETDVDCGGTYAPKCDANKACKGATDCLSQVCAGVCQPPSFTDGLKNGTESDVDCGGATAPLANKCDTGKACTAHADCKSDGCGDDGKCAAGRSCTQTHGGRTCGPGEYPSATHESCCTELPVAGRSGTLDKYLITAGRMRAFIDRVNGNVRDAVASDPKWVGAWTQYLPTNMAQALEQLGPVAQDWEWPAANTPGLPRGTWAARGCQVNGGGSRSYWEDRADDQHKYPKDALDEKTLNCVTTSMALAFCLWDGKDLADPDDLQAAWQGTDRRAWPWGNQPTPPLNERDTSFDYKPFDQAVVRFDYQFPAYSAPDATAHISAPGRKPAGNGPYGHADLVGNVIEEARRGNRVYYQSNGSWERHAPQRNGAYYTDNTTVFNRRYYAIGARCARH